ncbi:hypothetical protein K490DRAFT_74087 [Saccharata proteae CBS 121410]|uniref:WHIM1 domain-containing protein n=1 Tax=Saccharata proteae CBS 121410 TaxID=1314787 RepID=A0A9P4LY91_9PEZI|nr:hypothetical protein K490DRAFT_74087 [Saccharata proteae CBS 121410]
MSDSDLSSALSSPPATDDEAAVGPLDKFFKKKPAKQSSTTMAPASPPVKRKRAESPPHEEVLADNPDIAFIVMFRSRFADAFPPKLAHLGPQDIERGVVDTLPSPQVESLLCALLGLVLNRKKPVENGHYSRAMEEAVQTQKNQWPHSWNMVNPLHGGKSFNNMTPQERLNLLKTLIMWSLSTSDAVSTIIKESYKQSRRDDDLNQPLSVQPWGQDGDKRRYWLVEGKDDTNFRLYRESNPVLKRNTWWSIAGTIDELRAVAQRLADDGNGASRKLSERIMAAVPRFEATEDKRKRREYRQSRKAQFMRPEPGFPSLYEGRTRGKKLRYTYSDDEDDASDATSTRRSTRHSGRATPADPSKPVVTSSGRQVRSRFGGTYGETLLSGQAADAEHEERGRTATNGWSRGKRKHIEGYNSLDDMEDESEASLSGHEWDGGDDEEDVVRAGDDEDEDMAESDEASDDNAEPASLVVKLKYGKVTHEQDEQKEPSSDINPAPDQVPTEEQPAESGATDPTEAKTEPEIKPQPGSPKAGGEGTALTNGSVEKPDAHHPTTDVPPVSPSMHTQTPAPCYASTIEKMEQSID